MCYQSTFLWLWLSQRCGTFPSLPLYNYTIPSSSQPKNILKQYAWILKEVRGSNNSFLLQCGCRHWTCFTVSIMPPKCLPTKQKLFILSCGNGRSQTLLIGFACARLPLRGWVSDTDYPRSPFVRWLQFPCSLFYASLVGLPSRIIIRHRYLSFETVLSVLPVLAIPTQFLNFLMIFSKCHRTVSSMMLLGY